MGSPAFAIPSLRALAGRFTIPGVVTQPDRQAGRGRTLTSPPVKQLAEQLGIPVIQPQRFSQPEALEQLRAWEPDVIVVVAFGQILRQPVLDLAPHGCINVHASLLPRWRGAAPVQATILHGDAQTGVSLMRLDAGVDTGPVFCQRSEPILPDDNAASLGQRLAELGATMLVETLPDYLAGKLESHPQDEARATYAPMLKKEDGELDFTKSATSLEHKVRAFKPWPSAYTIWQGEMLKIHRCAAQPFSPDTPPPPPGTRLVYRRLPAIATADGLLALQELQLAGKKVMPGEAFLQGARDWA
jgi:methionyl-tRNA formyltransferase